jgi:hypothetical protein
MSWRIQCQINSPSYLLTVRTKFATRNVDREVILYACAGVALQKRFWEMIRLHVTLSTWDSDVPG